MPGMRLFNSILNILRFNRRSWKAIVLCFFAATIFWFFNALNKTYTTNVNFPVVFEFDRENFVPVKSLPSYVRINVTGNGWDLFKRGSGVKSAPLEIPLERPSAVKKIAGSTIPFFFNNQIDGMEINFVLTDTLFIDLEPKDGRWIKLAMDSLQFNLRKGFGVASEVSIRPDSIFIEGPQPIVNRFKSPFRLRLRQRNIDENFREEVEMDFPASDIIRRSPTSVFVSFDVQPMMIVEDSVWLDFINIPATVSKVERIRIPLIVAVPEKMMEDLSLDSAKAIIDLRNFKRGSEIVMPRLEGLSPYIRIIKLDSVNITL
jgi:hypothetical protein